MNVCHNRKSIDSLARKRFFPFIFVLIMSASMSGALAQDRPTGDNKEVDRLFVARPTTMKAASASPNLQFSLIKSNGLTDVLIWGTVGLGDSERVKNMLAVVGPLREIEFLSPGGSLEEGLEIGRIIRHNKLTTHIPTGYSCDSACNFMFMGGVVRYINPGGWFRVHMFSSGLTEEDREALRQMKNSQETAEQYNAAHPGEHISGEDAAATILSDRILDIQQEAAKYAAEIALFLVEMRLSLRFLTEFANIPNSSPRPLTRNELRTFNIVNDN